MPTEAPEKPAPTTDKPDPKPGEVTSSFLSEMMHGDRPAKKDKPAPAAAPAEDEAAKAAKAAADAKAAEEAAAKAKADEAKVKPAPVAAPAAPANPAATAPTPTEPNYEAIAEAAARGTASAMKGAPGKPADDPLTDLNDEEREMHEVLDRMEKDHPQYKGKLSGKYVDYLRGSEKWEEQWLAKHPELDQDSPEFQKDLAKYQADNEPKYADIHFQKTLAKMEADKTVEKERGRENKELESLKAKDRLREESPKIMATRVGAAKEYFAGLGDAFKGVLDTHGNINNAEIAKLLEADPLNAIAMDAATAVEVFSENVHTLFNQLVPFDEKNPAHSYVADYVAAKEAEMQRLPVAQQVNEQGQRFVTAEEYATLPAAQRKFYYRLNQSLLVKKFAEEQAATVKTKVAAEEKRIEQLAAKRGYVKAPAGNHAPAPKTEAVPAPVPTPPPSPSPSGAAAPISALQPQNPGGNGKNKVSAFTELFLS